MGEPDRSVVPALELRVFATASSLSYELRLCEPRPDEARVQTFGPVDLKLPLADYLAELWSDLEEAYDDSPKERALAERRQIGLGARLAEQLFPEPLRRCLAAWSTEPRSLVIVSDEPRIPWEIAWLERGGPEPEIGCFLAEAFALARWLPGRREIPELPFQDIALLVASGSQLPNALSERAVVLGLATRDRRVREISAEPLEVVEEIARGGHDAWHFIGHSSARAKNADRWPLELGGGARLRPDDVRSLDIGGGAPFVFLNSCTSGRRGFTLSGFGGWSERFLALGAGAFLGPQWSVRDRSSSRFAELFYERFRRGVPIAEAVRQARVALAPTDRGTRLSYALHAHPEAVCMHPDGPPADAGERPRRARNLSIPERTWRSGVESPAALLLAEHAIVPLHGREAELADLGAWCRTGEEIAVRLYTGAGGMGKTRLAIELCRDLWREGWTAGFAARDAGTGSTPWTAGLRLDREPTLVVVDYAESHRDAVVALLDRARERKPKAFRLLLLARDAWEWWDRLRAESGSVGSLLGGPATEHRRLRPVALDAADRRRSFEHAATAFAERLGQPVQEVTSIDFEPRIYERVLLLHMAALAGFEGVEIRGEKGLYDHLLDRERRDWLRRAKVQRLDPAIAEGLGRAMAVITLAGGAANERQAIEILRRLDVFATERAAVLSSVARLLHETYPGERWIEPLQPDPLGEHLAWREALQAGPGSDLERLLFASTGGSPFVS